MPTGFSRSAEALLVVMFACLALGCSSKSDFPATATVRGKVTYNGKPVSEATVAFLCDGAPRQAIGQTDETGSYQLSTFQKYDGAVIGTHVVTVTKLAENDSSMPDTDVEISKQEMNRAIRDSMMQTANQLTEGKNSEIPEKYSRHDTSTLIKEVIAGDNVINLELTD